MSEQTSAEIIQAMLDVIPNYRRWLKEGYESFNGQRHCLLGAYEVVTRQSDEMRSISKSPALQALARVIAEQYPERVTSGDDIGRTIFGFNDHARTRYTDVRRVLEKAAAHEEVPE